MVEVPKDSKARSAERIYDRLTVLMMNHELLLNGTHGPLNEKQKAILRDMVQRSRELATMLREILDS